MWSRKRALSEKKNERVNGRTAGLLVHNVIITLISQEEKKENIGDLARINAAHKKGGQ